MLYICTGRYVYFWNNFYNSAQQYFLPNCEKHYFVFSDQPVDLHSNENVHYIYQKKLGWPLDTLMRFHMFKSIENKLASFDYVFFFNANIVFLQPINIDILPTAEEGLLVVRHLGFYNKPINEYTYDRNPYSTAFIPFNTGKDYVQGSFNGGTSKSYIQMINDLVKNIDLDEDNKVTALWHDESHLNKYILTHNYKILSPAYIYPEGWYSPFEKKVMMLDKNKHGGHDYLRGISNQPIINTISFALKLKSFKLFLETFLTNKYYTAKQYLKQNTSIK